MDDAESGRIKRRFDLVVGFLPTTRVLMRRDIEKVVEGLRGVPLRIENEPAVPRGGKRLLARMTGACLALRDEDFVLVRTGLDPLSEDAGVLHEIAHLLLNHVPRPSDPSSVPSYAELRAGTAAIASVFRALASPYGDPREREAETLATLLLDLIRRQATTRSNIERDVLG